MVKKRYGAECPYCHRIVAVDPCTSLMVAGACDHWAGITSDAAFMVFRPTSEAVQVRVRELPEEENADG